MNRPWTLTDYLARLVGQPNLSLGLGAFLIGLLGNTLAGLASGWSLVGIPGNLIVIAALMASVILLYLYLKRKAADIRLQVEERAPEGKAGLILLLSTFDPRIRGSDELETKQRTEAARRAAEWIAQCTPEQLTSDDFKLLANSNLEPALAALEWHLAQGTLRDCWTIGSPDDPECAAKGEHTGSAWLGVVLQRWFEHAHPEARGRVTFHPTIVVPPRDYLKLGQTVDQIFERAPYKPQHVICDITGGQKTMSIGAALACIAEGRTMQYMSTGRDWKGEPLKGEKIVPILVDVSPYWVQRTAAPAV